MSASLRGTDRQDRRGIGIEGQAQLAGHTQAHITTGGTHRIRAQHISAPKSALKSGALGVLDVESQKGHHHRLTLSPDDHILFEYPASPRHARVRSERVHPCGIQHPPFWRQNGQLCIKAGKQLFHERFNAVECTENGDHGRTNGRDHHH